MLKQNLPYFTKIIDNVSDIIYTYDKEWRLTYMNRSAENFWGCKKENLLGKVIWDEFTESSGTIFYTELHRAMEEFVHVEIEAFAPVQGKWVIAHATPIEEGLIICAQDITERKKLELLYKNEAKMLSELIELCPLGIYVTDTTGKCITINEAALALLFPAYTKEEIMNQELDDRIKAIAIKREDSPVHKALQGLKVHNQHYQVLNKELLVYAVPIKDMESELTGALVIAHDVTDYTKLQSEMGKWDRLNLVGEMAASIGHEIRNPMATVRGYLQWLMKKDDFKQYNSQFDTMIEELDRANDIITEFLSLAKNKICEFTKEKLNELLKSLTPLVQADGLERGHEVVWDLQDTPELMLSKKDIRQLVLNLVRNSFEAMERKGTVLVKTYCNPKSVILAVQDTGPGISKEYLAQLGTPFFTTKENGTGIGLSICYRIAEQHKAILRFDTGPEGTTAFVEFRGGAV